MVSKFFIVLSICILFFNSCKKQDINASGSNYLIFGHFFGECVGERCIEIFRLESDKVFEDINDVYPTSNTFYKGNYFELPQQKFNDVKELTAFFPGELLRESKTVVGQPDAGDWGGLYIEYSFNNRRRFWLLDKNKSNVPIQYHNFIDKVNEKILLLK